MDYAANIREGTDQGEAERSTALQDGSEAFACMHLVAIGPRPPCTCAHRCLEGEGGGVRWQPLQQTGPQSKQAWHRFLCMAVQFMAQIDSGMLQTHSRADSSTPCGRSAETGEHRSGSPDHSHEVRNASRYRKPATSLRADERAFHYMHVHQHPMQCFQERRVLKHLRNQCRG